MWLKTSKMAARLGMSVAWLKKQMGVEFREGTHYVKPTSRTTLWNVAEMEKWTRRKDETDEQVEAILAKVI